MRSALNAEWWHLYLLFWLEQVKEAFICCGSVFAWKSASPCHSCCRTCFLEWLILVFWEFGRCCMICVDCWGFGDLWDVVLCFEGISGGVLVWSSLFWIVGFFYLRGCVVVCVLRDCLYLFDFIGRVINLRSCLLVGPGIMNNDFLGWFTLSITSRHVSTEFVW